MMPTSSANLNTCITLHFCKFLSINQVLSELSQIHPQVKREAGEREMLELAKAREQSMAAHSKKVNENREHSWKLPDAQPKDTSRAPPSVAALKVPCGYMSFCPCVRAM